MKKIHILTFLFCSFISSSIFAQNALIPRELRVQSYVRLEKMDSIFQNPFKTYKYTEITNFNILLLNALTSKKWKVYENSSSRNLGLYSLLTDTVPFYNIEEELGIAEESLLEYDKHGDVSKITKVKPVLDTAQLKFIVDFEESWKYDAKKFIFEKQVVNLDIIKGYFEPETGEITNKSIGVIYNNATATSQPILIAKVAYEQSAILPNDFFDYQDISIYKTQMDNAGLYIPSTLYDYNTFGEYARQRLFESLCTNVLNGNLQAVDFTTRQVLDSAEIAKRLGASIDTLIVMDERGDDRLVVVPTPPNLTGFNAMIFTEEWYFDSATFTFTKKVKEIALVYYSYDDTDTDFLNPKRDIVFSVKLN